MKRFFFLSTVCIFCLCILTEAMALTANDRLKVALTEDLILSPVDFRHSSGIRPPLNDRDLCLAAIYGSTGTESLWVSAKGPGPKAAVILDYLEKSYQEGLNPKKYEINQISALWSSTSPASLARLDCLLTYNLAKYIHDMRYGPFSPLGIFSSHTDDDADTAFDVVAAVKSAIAASDLKVYLNSLAPSHYFYRGLREALKVYRTIAKAGGWPSIPPGKTLHPGDRDPRLPLIYKRLVAPGIPPVPTLNSDTYGPELEKAVKKFQLLFGLDPDGIIGVQTLAAMNIPASSLVQKIIVNMARWRWQAHSLGNRYVLINIANFTLNAYEDHKIVLSFPVIIGQLRHQTPVFSSRIRTIQFNPYWTITPGIAKNEELPNLRKNPSYLVDQHVRLFSDWQADAVEIDSTKVDWQTISRAQMGAFRLRQDPGPWNALGRIKFEFPNKYSIYMHDTPAKDLFAFNKRDFSHGCIRLGNPLALAIFVLEDQRKAWSPEEVEWAYFSDKRETVRLDHPLPIHITYQTSWVDKNGAIHFNKDIYLRDENIYKALLGRDDKISSNVRQTTGGAYR